MRTTMFRNYYVTLATILLITGCATITQDSKTTVTVQSSPEGADCYVLQSGEKVTTPGVISLARQCRSVTLICNKKGYEQTTKVIPSKLATAMAGNFLLGGPIGAGIDGLSGKGCTYEDNIIVVMNKKTSD